MKDLREKAIRGGLAKTVAQGTNFVLRVGSLMVLARLLDPKAFGLVGMVTAVIGVLNLFRDFGLSTATVQRASVTEEQISTLFWINILVGTILGLLSAAGAPFLVAFYHEPRLLWVTVALATGFLFNAAGVQHSALLQRQMRFTALSVIDILSLAISTAVGIGMAVRGFGYWALVAMTLLGPLVSTICVWLLTKWVPGGPHKRVGIRSMMRFGGTLTLNGLVVYIAYNLEKVLLGRFWGAETVGIYGRAYQLVNIPTDNLNSAVGGVSFAALSRLQEEPQRLRSYFLKAYSLVLALTLPTTIACALFANDLIPVLLGPKWKEAIPIFRLLAPTILIFAMINPFAWLLFSIGKVGRSLKIALVIAPLVIAGYVIGLPHGPKGVALGYSVAMSLWLVPHIVWCVHGTAISPWDVARTLSRPLLSGIVAAILPFAGLVFYGHSLSPLPRLVIGVSLFLTVYLGMLLYVLGEKAFYLDIARSLRRGPPAKPAVLVSGLGGGAGVAPATSTE
jgi:PST family polysaccharide transporter